MSLTKRTQAFVAERADAYQQRADELTAITDELEAAIDPFWHGAAILTLRDHAAHWQALADGARSVAHDDRQQQRAAQAQGDGR